MSELFNPQNVLLGFVVAFAIFVPLAIFIHANVRLRFDPLEQLVATPVFHHWHHANENPATTTKTTPTSSRVSTSSSARFTYPPLSRPLRHRSADAQNCLGQLAQTFLKNSKSCSFRRCPAVGMGNPVALLYRKQVVSAPEAFNGAVTMRSPARHALLLLAVFPLAALFAENAALPPPLAALRAKAEAGNSIARYNLGVAYAQGREIPADPIEAFVWLNLAAESGIAGKDYDQLLQVITPAQLAEAKRRIALQKNSTPPSPVVLAPLDSPILLDSPSPERLTELTAKNQQLAAELAAAQAKLAAASQAAGRAALTAKADANTIVDSLNAKLTALDTQLTAAKSAAAQAQSAETARAQLAREKLTLDETIATLTAEKNTLATRLEQATAAKPDPAAPKIAALEAETARAHQRTAALQAQIDELTADRANLKQKLAEASRAPAPKSDDSSARISALQAQVAALTAAKPAPAPAASEELASTKAKLETALRSFTVSQNESARLKAATEVAVAETASLRQQLAAIQNKPISNDDPAQLKRQLTDAEAKLTQALRSYSVINAENEELKTAAASRADSSTQAIAAAEARAAAGVSAQAAQLAEVRDQLRQVQAQSASYAEENFQLRTRLASGGTTASAPTRASETLIVLPVPTTAPAAPTPAPPAASAARTHTIVAGDTLQGLAKKYYNDASRWNEILAANRDALGAKQTLIIGRKLSIP